MKRNASIMLIVAILVLSLIPISAYACGGFVALRGETIFHSVYCEEIWGVEYNSLIWFNKASDAEVWGYTMCEECSIFHDYNFDTDYCDYYFETDNPLLLTAMELSFTYGSDGGYEMGRESALEDLGYEYENGYDAGYEDGRYQGRVEGREEAETEYERNKEEMRENRECLFAIVLGLVAIGYIINWLDNRKKKI